MESLPNDIVADILSRVPVKNILQIKCVCKLWHTIISHPKFVNMQLKQSYPGNNQKNGGNRILVFSFSDDVPQFLDYDEQSSIAATHKFAVSNLDFPLKDDECYPESRGSCNGLVCVQVRKDTSVIWNPSIRQHRILPKDDDYGIYGLGYDSVNDDYKVVKAYAEHGLKVFSLKRNTWRSIEEPNYKYITHHCTNFLNGSLHWLARRNFPPRNLSGEDIEVFVAFSLAEEKFVAEVPKPDVDGVEFEEMNVFDGCLCLYRYDNNVGVGTGFEIWVMKEYMVRASWTKLCTILWETIPRDFHRFLRPLCYSQDGDILLEIGLCGVVKYNMKEKKCSTAVFNLPPSDEYDEHADLEALAYVDSLVSPNYDGA